MAKSEGNNKVPSASKPPLLVDEKSEVPAALTDLIDEAWRRANLTEAYQHQNHLNVIVNMERIIGRVMVVNTDPIALTDETLFSRKRFRRYVSRVAKIKTSPESRYVSLTCDRHGRDWRLRRAEIGAFVAPEPLDFTTILRRGATLDGVMRYWTRHAHVYRAADFSTSAHLDTWTRLLSAAHRNHRPEVLQQIGYWDFARAHHVDLTDRRY